MCVEAVLIRFNWFIPIVALVVTARPVAAQEARDLPPQVPVVMTSPVSNDM